MNRCLRGIGFELRRAAIPDPFEGIWRGNAHDGARMRTMLAALLGYQTTELIHSLLVGELAYRIYDLDGTGPMGAEQFRDVYEIAEEINFLARP